MTLYWINYMFKEEEGGIVYLSTITITTTLYHLHWIAYIQKVDVLWYWKIALDYQIEHWTLEMQVDYQYQNHVYDQTMEWLSCKKGVDSIMALPRNDRTAVSLPNSVKWLAIALTFDSKTYPNTANHILHHFDRIRIGGSQSIHVATHTGCTGYTSTSII